MHAMEAGGGRGVAPLILNFGTVWRRVVNLTPRSLYTREKHRYQLNRRLGLTQSRYGLLGKEKTHLPLPGFESQTV
jgi:hypothetical protein